MFISNHILERGIIRSLSTLKIKIKNYIRKLHMELKLEKLLIITKINLKNRRIMS